MLKQYTRKPEKNEADTLNHEPYEEEQKMPDTRKVEGFRKAIGLPTTFT